jgi:hypothetical protein
MNEGAAIVEAAVNDIDQVIGRIATARELA